MLLDNPFYVLGVSTRDNKAVIMDAADEMALELDEVQCQKALNALIKPQDRIYAELDWFVGVSPKEVERIMSYVKNNDDSLLYDLDLDDTSSALSFINVSSSFLEQNSNIGYSLEDIVEWVASAFDNIDYDEIERLINEEREISKFPMLANLDLEEIQKIIENKKHRLVNQIFKKLSSLDNEIECITSIVEYHTGEGYGQAPNFVENLIEQYKLKYNDFLKEEIENIKEEIEIIKDVAPSGEENISYEIGRLLKNVKKWDEVAQPIQLIAQSCGIDDPVSTELARELRNLAIDLYNKYGYLESSTRISNELAQIFAELPEMAERIDEDITTLDDISNKKRRSEQEQKAFIRSLNCDVEIGLIFKENFIINNGMVSWKGRKYVLENITKITWGGVSRSINGIPTGTDYKIKFNGKDGVCLVETKMNSKYSTILDRLWRGAGVKILASMVEELGNGSHFTFDNLVVYDSGVEITKRGFFSDKTQRFGWNDITIGSKNGAFLVYGRYDSSFCAELSYIDTYNVHILEMIIRAMFKNPKTNLLSEAFND
ncbi:MAG: hypothetical protein MR658_00860 [Campylobacter sp.]|uniref:hypothetical protein n=1 Tax=Campylobacter sp. TaxID=205 RepID=UPI002A74FD75|nr:hypothetical protein [Campylobacter sp.]MCI6177374.1 hypothetical protein [Campylobacter sp.]MCI7501126.1 hypothetical protein [Campylobacter sp.]MDY3245204.1 hypothetical protein [Campylobacter sp.]